MRAVRLRSVPLHGVFITAQNGKRAASQAPWQVFACAEGATRSWAVTVTSGARAVPLLC